VIHRLILVCQQLTASAVEAVEEWMSTPKNRKEIGRKLHSKSNLLLLRVDDHDETQLFNSADIAAYLLIRRAFSADYWEKGGNGMGHY